MATSTSDSASPRSRALDVFRGVTIAGMILVNYAGPLSAAPAALKHADWHGFTPTDLVFPSFLFIVGVAMSFALRAYGHQLTRVTGWKIARRAVWLFVVGLGINAFPFVGIDYSKLTYMGVLQRIGLCYGIVSVLCLTLSPRALAGVAVGLLAGYWALLAFGGSGDPYSVEGALPTHVDRALFGGSHLNPDYVPPFEPEGLLGTIPSLVNVIAGYLAGRWIAQAGATKRAIAGLLAAGVPLIVLGRIWDLALPINKPLWTSSFAVYTIGLTLALLALAIWAIDVRGWARPLAPFVAFGMNPLLIYVLATECKGGLTFTRIGDRSTYAWMHEALFVPLFGATLGAVILAGCWVVVMGGIAWHLYRRQRQRARLRIRPRAPEPPAEVDFADGKT